MGKAARSRRKARRDDEKRKRKAANRARYASLVGTEANKKKKNKRLAQRRLVKRTTKAHQPNVATNPWLADPSSCLYGKRWSSPLSGRYLEAAYGVN